MMKGINGGFVLIVHDIDHSGDVILIEISLHSGRGLILELHGDGEWIGVIIIRLLDFADATVNADSHAIIFLEGIIGLAGEVLHDLLKRHEPVGG